LPTGRPFCAVAFGFKPQYGSVLAFNYCGQTGGDPVGWLSAVPGRPREQMRRNLKRERYI